MLEVRLLGTIDIRLDNQAITISSRPAQSLFSYLILHPGIHHRREKLASLLWADSPEETARGNLRHALWQLRKAFPRFLCTEYLISDETSITFNAPADFWLDVAELLKVGNASIDELKACLQRYQGEFMPGFYEE